ncbi:MAG TPA: TIGR03118 family protein [Ktedonobacteraceae bacterium]
MRVWILSGRSRPLAFGALFSLLLLLAWSFMVTPQSAYAATHGHYQQTNLVSDLADQAPLVDKQLVNPWGLVASPTSPWWISDNGTGLSTLYNGQGAKVPLTVTVPPPKGSPAGTISAPTGIIFNGTSGFTVSENGQTGPSLFVFATEDGTISGWNPTVDRTNAILTVDRSKVGPGAVYKGLAIGSNADGTFLFATNFRFGDIEVFNENFELVHTIVDPTLPFGYAPFGIQDIGGNLYVTFALRDSARHDDVAGPGHGFVDVFSTQGRLLRRLISHGRLNSPWGLALAPANFGRFSYDLLVGNFGDGRIHAYDPRNGEPRGVLRDSKGHPISIDGLWALQFGNGAAAGATNQLFFTAGTDEEAHGLFGFIQAAPASD